MTPTQLATINSNTAAQTTWVTASVTFPAGMLGVVAVGVSGALVNAGFAVTDSGGNTWTVRGEANANSGSAGSHSCVAECYFASSATVAVTVSFTSLNMRTGWCGYTDGTDTAPFDAVGTSTPSATSNTVTTSTALTADGEIGFVAFHVASNATGPNTWPTAGYTSLFVANDATRGRTGAFEYQVVTGGSGSTLSSGAITYTTSQMSAATIATYKPAAGGGGAVTPAIHPRRMPLGV